MLTHLHIDNVEDMGIRVCQHNGFVTVEIENTNEHDRVVFFLRNMDEAESLADQIRVNTVTTDPAV
mgnify:CR=1 FL=1